MGVVAAGEVLVGVVVVAVDVGLPGYALVEALAAVAVCETVVARTEAADAVPPLAAPDPVEPSPSVSSSLARFASADCRLAFACSSVTSALCGSSVASNWPCVTCWPWVTSMCVTVPPVLKPRLSWLRACRLPLPDTVDCTTPWATVAVRVTVAWLLDAGPTSRTAATIAPAQRAPST